MGWLTLRSADVVRERPLSYTMDVQCTVVKVIGSGWPEKEIVRMFFPKRQVNVEKGGRVRASQWIIEAKEKEYGIKIYKTFGIDVVEDEDSW